MRYLQDCIEKLQSRDPQTPPDKTNMSSSFQPAPYNAEAEYQSHQRNDADRDDDDDEEEDEQQQHSPDVEMANTADITPSPTFTNTRPSSATTTVYSSSTHHHQYYQASTSPALGAQDGSAMHRHGSYASIHSADHHRHYSFSTSSPSWGAGYILAPLPSTPGGSTLTSPALGPLREERDLDHEATAALLMLNSDRRGTTVVRDGGASSSGSGSSSAGAGRGMSVRDLLSA